MVIRKVSVDLAEELGDGAAQSPKKIRRVGSRNTVAAVDRDLHRTRDPDIAGDAIDVRRHERYQALAGPCLG